MRTETLPLETPALQSPETQEEYDAAFAGIIRTIETTVPAEVKKEINTTHYAKMMGGSDDGGLRRTC